MIRRNQPIEPVTYRGYTISSDYNSREIKGELVDIFTKQVRVKSTNESELAIDPKTGKKDRIVSPALYLLKYKNVKEAKGSVDNAIEFPTPQPKCVSCGKGDDFLHNLRQVYYSETGVLSEYEDKFHLEIQLCKECKKEWVEIVQKFSKILKKEQNV